MGPALAANDPASGGAGSCVKAHTESQDFGRSPPLLVGATIGIVACVPHSLMGGGVPVQGDTGIEGAIDKNWEREKRAKGTVGAVLLSPLWVIDSLATPKP